MRKDLCKDNICFPDGSLNLKYFNVKKGHYWSRKETKLLLKGVQAHGATNFKQIRKDCLPDWTETEIRLRICKLLRYYDLSHYKDVKFNSEEQILAEAKKNREEAQKIDDAQVETMRNNCNKPSERDKITRPRDPKLVGGIHFNPPPLSVVNKEYQGQGAVSVFQNFFSKDKKDKKVND